VSWCLPAPLSWYTGKLKPKGQTAVKWLASAGPLLWKRLPVKARAQILSSSFSSTPCLCKSFLFPGTGGRLRLVFTASGALYKYVNKNRIE